MLNCSNKSGDSQSLDRAQQSFSVSGHIVNIFTFAGPTASVAATQPAETTKQRGVAIFQNNFF